MSFAWATTPGDGLPVCLLQHKLSLSWVPRLPTNQLGPVLLAVAAAGSDYKYSFQVGLLCLVGTFAANGTHSVFAKVAGNNMSPFLYTLFLGCGLLFASTVAVAAMGEPFELSLPGLMGGILLSVALTTYINAIMLVGIV